MKFAKASDLFCGNCGFKREHSSNMQDAVRLTHNPKDANHLSQAGLEINTSPSWAALRTGIFAFLLALAAVLVILTLALDGRGMYAPGFWIIFLAFFALIITAVVVGIVGIVLSAITLHRRNAKRSVMLPKGIVGLVLSFVAVLPVVFLLVSSAF